MLRYPCALAGCALLIATAGCGLTSSPAEHLTFKAPAGWQGTPGVMGFMQLWRAPGSSDQVLMLFKSPKPLKTGDVLNSADLKDTRVVTTQHANICGNQPAEMVTAQGTSQRLTQKSRNVTMDMVMSDANGTTYIAAYVYPTGTAPDPAAAAAIKELCAK